MPRLWCDFQNGLITLISIANSRTFSFWTCFNFLCSYKKRVCKPNALKCKHVESCLEKSAGNKKMLLSSKHKHSNVVLRKAREIKNAKHKHSKVVLRKARNKKMLLSKWRRVRFAFCKILNLIQSQTNMAD